MNYSKYIDHTLLKATALKEDIKKLCDEAIKYNFKSVCVNPCFVKYAKDLLKNSDVLVCTVIGFPLGATTTNTKVYEAREAIINGASEIDMVINVGYAKEHDYDSLYKDILEVREVTKGYVLKVILETCYLSSDELIECSKMALKAEADFVKTSTGFGSAGARVEDVILMKQTAQDKMQVKASGGIRSKSDFLKMIEAGASRIGCSAGVKIMEELENE